MCKPSPNRFVRLSPGIIIGDFDCDDSDLNDFLYNDACDHLRQLLAVTYLLMDQDRIIAFFSVSNDSLISDPRLPGINKVWNRLTREIPNEKRRKSFPAVKLGRLGVIRSMQGKGLGTEIIGWMKMSFVTQNKTGCRFITVDAYNNPKALRFYENNEFQYFPVDDRKKDTRQMYYDLKPFHDRMIQTTASSQLG